jgi:8-oxo-dGTP pyrophosphatase MutT (NUDIX family)
MNARKKTEPRVVGYDREITGDERGEHPWHPSQRRPRDAATLVLYQLGGREPRVLMGQRSAKHAFMAQRYVFPGGGVDRMDARVPVATNLRPEVQSRLVQAATPARARALAVAAIRETFEETGLILGKPVDVDPNTVGPDWQGFLDKGLAPALDELDFICRAITPPRRPRRFNARFFMANAEHATGEIKGNGELVDIQWVPLSDALELNLPAVTKRVIEQVGEIAEMSRAQRAKMPIPLLKTVHGRHLVMEE